jgi:hypothetical protein
VKRPGRIAGAFGLVVFGSLVCASSFAAPPSKGGGAAAQSAKATCVAAHEQAQSLRTEKKPHAARAQYVACARVECPVVLRKECTDQLEQMEATAPTVAVEALNDKGMSDADVKVSLDGRIVAEKLTGAAIPVEPGEHVFKVERASDGKSIEQRVMVVEGEKNRKVVADFQTLLPPKSARASETEAQPIVVVQEPPRKIPVLAWVAGGVAAFGLGSFAVFSLMGRSSEDDLAKSCAPTCPEDQVSTVRRDYVIADISLGISLVAAAVAVVLALPALTASKPSVRASAMTTPWLPHSRLRLR